LLSELPVSTEVIGILPAIEAYVLYWSDRYSIPAKYRNEARENGSFGPLVDINLYRITQEALNNVAKHSRCSQVEVVISKSHNRLVLVVEDNGCGFDTDALADSDIHFVRGIEEMTTRAALALGDLTIESELATGTSVIVKIPIVEVDYHAEI
jgi:signal transduction histidine kinase